MTKEEKITSNPQEPIYMRGRRISAGDDCTLEAKQGREKRLETKLDHFAARLGVWSRDVAEDLADTLSLRYVDREELSSCYKMSESTWAGGMHTTYVYVNGTPGCEGWSERAWSDNGKWKGTNSFHEFNVTVRALQIFPSLLMQDHVILDAEPVNGHPNCYRAIWAEQSKGFTLRSARGWIVRGHLVEVESLQAAIKKARNALHKACKKGMLRYSRTLLEHGTDPNTVDKNGQTPIDYVLALPKNHHAREELLELLREYAPEAYFTAFCETMAAMA